MKNWICFVLVLVFIGLVSGCETNSDCDSGYICQDEVCVSIGKTLISGLIYKADDNSPIGGASVTVSCEDVRSDLLSSSNGTYSVVFEKKDCSAGSDLNVYVEFDGMSATKSGIIHEEGAPTYWDVGIVNVPMVPEFGFFMGVLTLLISVTMFFFLKK